MKFYTTVASILILSSFLITSCNSKKSTPNKENLESELIIFHAGSLSVPFHQLADNFTSRSIIALLNDLRKKYEESDDLHQPGQSVL